MFDIIKDIIRDEINLGIIEKLEEKAKYQDSPLLTKLFKLVPAFGDERKVRIGDHEYTELKQFKPKPVWSLRADRIKLIVNSIAREVGLHGLFDVRFSLYNLNMVASHCTHTDYIYLSRLWLVDFNQLSDEFRDLNTEKLESFSRADFQRLYDEIDEQLGHPEYEKRPELTDKDIKAIIYIIILRENPEKTQKTFQTIIAHELAHLYYQHNNRLGLPEIARRHERQADIFAVLNLSNRIGADGIIHSGYSTKKMYLLFNNFLIKSFRQKLPVKEDGDNSLDLNHDSPNERIRWAKEAVSILENSG